MAWQVPKLSSLPCPHSNSTAHAGAQSEGPALSEHINVTRTHDRISLPLSCVHPTSRWLGQAVASVRLDELLGVVLQACGSGSRRALRTQRGRSSSATTSQPAWPWASSSTAPERAPLAPPRPRWPRLSSRCSLACRSAPRTTAATCRRVPSPLHTLDELAQTWLRETRFINIGGMGPSQTLKLTQNSQQTSV